MFRFKTKKQSTLLLGLLLFLTVFFTGCSSISDSLDTYQNHTNTEVTTMEEPTSSEQNTSNEEIPHSEQKLSITEDGLYTSKNEVALYIHTFEKLPSNYITKKDARALGWDNKKGNLWDVTDKKSIGGDRFGNYEKALPEQKNRNYYECDIDYEGGYRNEKRIVYSNDGLIFYTEDHYQTFEQLYK